jgi:membrane protein DedA with SNARE-associated domain
MQYVASDIERYGLLGVFFAVLLAEGGLPLPVLPILMTAGALMTESLYQALEIISAGVSGSMIADLAWYWSGKRHGQRVMGLLCKMSLSPDSCVRQTETLFLKVGPWSLLFMKFLPAISTVSAAMAGVTKMALPAFLLLNGIGALLSVGVAVVIGRIFQNAITNILLILADIGKFGVLLALAVFGLYLLARWRRRQAFIRQLSGDRITVDELRQMIDQGHKPLIPDVRPKEIRAREGNSGRRAGRSQGNRPSCKGPFSRTGDCGVLRVPE